MPLGKDAFLIYAYLYARHSGADDWLFQELWKKKEDLSDEDGVIAEARYFPERQALHMKHAAFDGLMRRNKFTSRDFWRKTIIFRKESPDWFVPGKLLPLAAPRKDLKDLWTKGIALGLVTKNNELVFHGALLQGVKRHQRASWFGVGNDEAFLENYKMAAAWASRSGYYSLGKGAFCAHDRAVRVEHGIVQASIKTEPGTKIVVASSMDEPPSKKENGLQELRVAVDSTLLLSADSYLGTILVPDPRAQEDFEFIVTVLCGCDKLYMRKPEHQPDDLRPLLSLFWKLTDPPATGKSLVTDEELIANFEVLMRDTPYHVRQLARHQLRDKRMDTIYWTGGNTPERLQEVYRVLKDANFFKRETPLQKVLGRRGFALTGTSATLAEKFGGPIPYVHTYLFNLVAKGPLYSQQKDQASHFHCAWPRTYAFSGVPKERLPFASLPPWGRVLAKLEGIAWERGMSRDDEKRFADQLVNLRKFTLDDTKDIVYRPNADPDRNVDYFFRGLNSARMIPPTDLGEHLRVRDQDIHGEIVTSAGASYGRTVRELTGLALDIARGWRPFIADRDTFRLEWEKPELQH